MSNSTVTWTALSNDELPRNAILVREFVEVLEHRFHFFGSAPRSRAYVVKLFFAFLRAQFLQFAKCELFDKVIFGGSSHQGKVVRRVYQLPSFLNLVDHSGQRFTNFDEVRGQKPTEKGFGCSPNRAAENTLDPADDHQHRLNSKLEQRHVYEIVVRPEQPIRHVAKFFIGFSKLSKLGIQHALDLQSIRAKTQFNKLSVTLLLTCVRLLHDRYGPGRSSHCCDTRDQRLEIEQYISPWIPSLLINDLTRFPKEDGRYHRRASNHNHQPQPDPSAVSHLPPSAQATQQDHQYLRRLRSGNLAGAPFPLDPNRDQYLRIYL